MSDEVQKFKEAAFNKIWHEGYFEGDPLESNSIAISYERIILADNTTAAFIKGKSSFHEIYVHCIKPYIDGTNVIEIGPGRGAWSKCMLSANNLYVLDALSAEYNKFWEYVGRQENVKYIEVKDFECKELPDAFFNYMFSFGALCHVSFDGITEYAKNLHKKLLPGANCFWMIADAQKFSKATQQEVSSISTKYDGEWRGWYFNNIDETCKMLTESGYIIKSRDLDLNVRDPIIYFQRV